MGETKKPLVFGECSMADFVPPHVSKEPQYCVLCAKGPFPAEQVKLITYDIDPYIQISEEEPGQEAEEDRVYACLPCFKAKYGDDDN